MKPLSFVFIAFISSVALQPTIAQPATDIFLAPVEWVESTLRAGDAKNITQRPGYDNQPSFLADSTGFLFTSYRAGQTDIYSYSLGSRTISRVTDTPESEYSPTPMRDGEGFSVVRVEADSTQRLWQFDADGGNPRLVLDDVQPVGYHAWGFDNIVALFILGDPPSLRVVDVASGDTQLVADHVGRSVQKIPQQRAVSFLQLTEDGWSIERYDVPTENINPLTPPLDGSLDHAWMPDGTHILMARGSSIYTWEPAGKVWYPVADFSDQDISGITRIATSPDGKWIAFVAEDG